MFIATTIVITQKTTVINILKIVQARYVIIKQE
jgi:hypothetical protein